MPNRLLQLLTTSILLSAAAAFGQTKTLRIVTYNIEDDINGATTPLPGLIAPWSGGPTSSGGVLEGIGEENVASDPAQPLDILALEETTSNPQTIAPIVQGLNAFYGVSNMYAMSPYQATESDGTVTDGNGPNALVYNTTTVQLVGSIPVDPPGGTNNLGSASGEYREVMRYEFAPAWDAPAASNEFYLYVSHYKSGTTSTDLTDRGEEAQIIRNNETNLPSNARVIYTGDYNVTASGEASYQTILAAASPTGIAQGQGFDPLNPTAANNVNWGTNTTNKAVLAMETESVTDVRYRDDLELMTSNVFYGAPGGLAWTVGTYHAFGNNGSVPYYGNIGTNGDTALTNLEVNAPIPAGVLYIDMTNASDHFPVVADYTVPFNPPALGIGAGTILANDAVQFFITNADGTAMTSGQAHYARLESAASLAGTWVTLSNAAILTNGMLLATDTNTTSSSRFYRAAQAP